MLETQTAAVLKAVIYGVASVLFGGFIFEGGKRYVKVPGSNRFKGKIQALPFFFLTVAFGLFVDHAETIVGPTVDAAVFAVPPFARLGVVLALTMTAFNYSVPAFNYFDRKSLVVYAVAGLTMLYSIYSPPIPV